MCAHIAGGRAIRGTRNWTWRALAVAWRLYSDAVRRGLFWAKRVVVLGDGAEWVKNIAQTHFGAAFFIIDYYHASEHIDSLCRALFDRDLKRANDYRAPWTDYLWEGQVQTIIDEAAAMRPRDPKAKKDTRTQIGYFRKNKDHRQYADYRQEHLFIGSGVVEAAYKHLIGARLKQSGMEWTVSGEMTSLRCAPSSSPTAWRSTGNNAPPSSLKNLKNLQTRRRPG